MSYGNSRVSMPLLIAIGVPAFLLLSLIAVGIGFVGVWFAMGMPADESPAAAPPVAIVPAETPPAIEDPKPQLTAAELRAFEAEQRRPWREIARFEGEGKAAVWSEPFAAQDATIRIVCFPTDGQTLLGEVEKQGRVETSFLWPAPHLEKLGGQFVASQPGELFRVKIMPQQPGKWSAIVQSK